MRITKITILCIVFILLASVIVANLIDLINVDAYIITDGNKRTPKRLAKVEPKFIKIEDSYDHLMWFLQISDIHISVFQDPSRIKQLFDFCNVTVDVIKPKVVLASGDLTDAKTVDKMGSTQLLSEWEHYRSVLKQSNVARKTLWLDLRGNHDNFDIISLDAPNNYYLNYSIQGRSHPRSYMYQLLDGSKIYTFIAVDACLHPGLKRPFNFIGHLDEKEVIKLKKFVDEALRTYTDYIIWFGHYPTSCIISPHEDVRKMMGENMQSLVYLSGHYHTLGGMVPNMYTLQHAGFLELELADWKESRMYRLAAIDHGQFSFIDLKIDHEWPIALITNPKHALYTIPQKENLYSMSNSTHIRVLAFSLSPMESVHVKVDNGVWVECKNVEGPLYAAWWDPTLHKEGLHIIQALVRDIDGRETTFKQPFSLDGTRLSYELLPRFILMCNASVMFQCLFACGVFLVIGPLCIFRCIHTHYTARNKRPRIRIKMVRCFLRAFWLLSSVNRLFWPIVLYALYLIAGPWAIGELIKDHTGVIFAWGIFVNFSYLPGGFTYVYGFFQLFTFHLPLTVILAFRAERRFQLLISYEERKESKPCFLLQNIPIVILITIQLVMVYVFYLAYGTVSVVVCPLRTWSIVLAIALWWHVNKMPPAAFKPAAAVWYPDDPPRRSSRPTQRDPTRDFRMRTMNPRSPRRSNY